ncbi:DUF484 family protein [Pseudohalioglobus sediminis]|uniref:DUF484 family protein n=1 Tax=Pseudohalioglobus sediminis TaxID=2606449 RepID=A0A5B0WQ27_9GAMM|nr:DUF484 family protein [Pseudohalioglobus sediminis]KAA1189204.1 DUF484 family protein [Pseudohalioglobus sediminis]
MAAGKEQAATVSQGSDLTEEQVKQYLSENGDFLQRNPDMLDHLHISHASGSAVSLVEKQVSILRERNIDMRHRLKALTTNARENDKLYDQTRKLVLSLLDAGSLDELYEAFMQAMSTDFKVDYASMILFGEPGAESACRIEDPTAAREQIGALLKGRKPVCGVLRKEELAYLFPDAGEVGSAALMPITNGEEQGLIAVGSADANRYTTNMGTLFLTHIADVIQRLLPRLR